VWRSQTPKRCVITTIMDQKVQLLKPLNKRELNTRSAEPLDESEFGLLALGRRGLFHKAEMGVLHYSKPVHSLNTTENILFMKNSILKCTYEMQ
jgi:hypothetical protein